MSTKKPTLPLRRSATLEWKDRNKYDKKIGIRKSDATILITGK